MTNEFPKSPEEVLAVIKESERRRKFAWTASRVLTESALAARLNDLTPVDRKALLLRITNLLESLAAQGILRRRADRQGIGYGQEIGFDYLFPRGKSK